MFLVQCLAGTEYKRQRVPTSEHAPLFKSIIYNWQTDSDLRKDILKEKRIPMRYDDENDVPGVMSGYYYELEPDDLQGLFAVFKRNKQARGTHSPFRETTQAEMQQAVEEVHAVYRILRQTVKDLGPRPEPQVDLDEDVPRCTPVATIQYLTYTPAPADGRE